MRLLVVLTAALTLAAGAGAASERTVPPTEKARIHAVLSPYDFYPASLPRGVIYISWEQKSLDPVVCGRNVTIQFAAAGGKEIDWSSSRDCDSAGKVRCSANGYPGYGFGIGFGAKRATINHRRVFFSAGNHGSDAWACIPLRVGGLADWAVVGIWESNFITPQQAMRLVAFARR